MTQPLVIEGRLLQCGDGYECAWLTLGGQVLEALLPEGDRLDTNTQCATIRIMHGAQVGPVIRHNVARWSLERVPGERYDHVFTDWGLVRLTVEFLDKQD